MLRPVLRRLVLSVPVLFLVSILTFLLTALIPGDPGRTLLGTNATVEAVAKINRDLGLDRPIYEQYWSWLERAVRGDLGESVFSGEPVTKIVSTGLPVTLTLIIGATLVAVVVGIPLGVRSARRAGIAGRVVDIASTLGFAIPSFWLGLLLVLLFSRTLGLVPPSGWVPFSESPTEWAQLIVLPIVTLAVGGIALVAKQTRDGMLNELEREYVRALRSRGVRESAIVYKHALRNGLPNVITLVGLYVVGLLLGTTLIESVFAMQGLGSIAVAATSQHDLPILQGVGVCFALIVLAVFCIADLLRAWLNPKLRS